MKITTVNDYVDEVAAQFPELTKDEVKRILNYGWKMILLYVSVGNDVSILTHDLFFFIGKLQNDAFKNFKYYCRKLAKRIAFMFNRKQEKWDGYYYFSRTERQYIEYLEQNKRKKYKVFKHVYMYKLLEELKISDACALYIFRVKEIPGRLMHKYYEEYKTDKAELIILRDPLNMSDILTSLNKFKYLQQI